VFINIYFITLSFLASGLTTAFLILKAFLIGQLIVQSFDPIMHLNKCHMTIIKDNDKIAVYPLNLINDLTFETPCHYSSDSKHFTNKRPTGLDAHLTS